jgi:hypothetical protein
MEAKEVSLSVALPSLGIGPLERRATKAEQGQWVLESLPMPLPGSWHVRIDVLVSDFEKATLEGEITVKPPGSRASLLLRPTRPLPELTATPTRRCIAIWTSRTQVTPMLISCGV